MAKPTDGGLSSGTAMCRLEEAAPGRGVERVLSAYSDRGSRRVDTGRGNAGWRRELPGTRRHANRKPMGLL